MPDPDDRDSLGRHCERSEAIQKPKRCAGLLRSARNDGEYRFRSARLGMNTAGFRPHAATTPRPYSCRTPHPGAAD